VKEGIEISGEFERLREREERVAQKTREGERES
jgi:hypothetical protein